MAGVRVATPEIRLHCGPTGLNEAVLSLDFLHPVVATASVAATSAGAGPSGANGANAGVASTAENPATTTEGDERAGEQPTSQCPPQGVVLATGGADKEIKLWRVTGAELTGNAGLDFVFSLSGHDRSVNCVRFSPNGTFLASASDDMSIILWTRPKTAAEDWRWDRIASLSDVSRTILACGHKGDITDLSWSPDSAFLCSTSVDNRCVIWDVEKGDVAERRKDHTQYVQGVAWDPLNEFLVTEGNDRTCRVYSLSGFGAATQTTGKKQSRKFACVQTLKTREFPPNPAAVATAATAAGATAELTKDSKAADAPASASTSTPASTPAPTVTEPPTRVAPPPKHRMFLDDTCPAFARRPAWTPDGSYFLAPTGAFRSTQSASAVNTVYAFSRGNLSQPTLHLPGQEKPSLGVRCSPLLYELRRAEGAAADSTAPYNLFKTQFRSIFAVITLDAVVLYDTQQSHPICTIKGLHYADLTDVSWTSDGQMLSISSMDGYVSFVQFEDGFFGSRVPQKDQAELNASKMRRMFATPKKPRKKIRTHAVANDQTAVKTLAARKKPKQETPIARAFKKSDGNPGEASAQPVVNTLQVRKKRKIVPTLVPVVNAAITAPQVVEASNAAVPDAQAVIDLSETAPASSAPAQQQSQQQHHHQQQSESTSSPAGTWEDPVNI